MLPTCRLCSLGDAACAARARSPAPDDSIPAIASISALDRPRSRHQRSPASGRVGRRSVATEVAYGQSDWLARMPADTDAIYCSAVSRRLKARMVHPTKLCSRRLVGDFGPRDRRPTRPLLANAADVSAEPIEALRCWHLLAMLSSGAAIGHARHMRITQPSKVGKSGAMRGSRE